MPVKWCRNDLPCWRRIVDKWFTPEWIAKHNQGREKRLLMRYPSHHQGNLNNEEYRTRWVWSEPYFFVVTFNSA